LFSFIAIYVTHVVKMLLILLPLSRKNLFDTKYILLLSPIIVHYDTLYIFVY